MCFLLTITIHQSSLINTFHIISICDNFPFISSYSNFHIISVYSYILTYFIELINVNFITIDINLTIIIDCVIFLRLFLYIEKIMSYHTSWQLIV